MGKKMFLQLIKDLSRCSKYKEVSDTHIKTTVNIKRGLNYDNFKSLQSNSFIYSLNTHENHPSLIFDNNEEKKIFERLIQKAECDTLMPHKNIKIKDKNFSSFYLINMKIASKIIHNLKKSNEKITIFEIGGGLGTLAQILLLNINCKIILCDMPQQLSIQKFYLSNVFKNKKHNFIANDKDKFLKDYDINYINCNQLHKQNFNFDVAINTNSFQEMRLSTVNKYIRFIEENLNDGGLFLHQNSIGHATGSSLYPTNYYLPNKFIIKNIEYSYPSVRGINFPNFTLICEKDTKHIAKRSLTEKRKKTLTQFYKSNSNKTLLKKNIIIKKSIINKLNLYEKKDHFKNGLLDEKNNFSDLKINYKFKSINESIITDLQKLDHSFLSTKKIATQILNENFLFKDYYWGMKLCGLFYGINDIYNLKQSLKLVNDNSFHVLFRKLILYNKVNYNKNNDKIYTLLVKNNCGDFLSNLKILYSLHLLEKSTDYHNKKNEIIKRVVNTDQAIILSRVIFNNSVNEYFDTIKKNNYLKNYISHDVLTEVLIDSNENLISKNNIFDLLKNINFKFKKDINSLILLFKTDQINENDFMQYVKNNIIDDYYLIGKVILKTFTKLSKNNLLFLIKKSSNLRKNNNQNDEFLGNILLHSKNYSYSMRKFKRIKNVDKNIFPYRVKYQICKSISKDSSFEFYLKKQRLSFITFEDQTMFFPFVQRENSSRLLFLNDKK